MFRNNIITEYLSFPTTIGNPAFAFGYAPDFDFDLTRRL